MMIGVPGEPLVKVRETQSSVDDQKSDNPRFTMSSSSDPTQRARGSSERRGELKVLAA